MTSSFSQHCSAIVVSATTGDQNDGHIPEASSISSLCDCFLFPSLQNVLIQMDNKMDDSAFNVNWELHSQLFLKQCENGKMCKTKKRIKWKPSWEIECTQTACHTYFWPLFGFQWFRSQVRETTPGEYVGDDTPNALNKEPFDIRTWETLLRQFDLLKPQRFAMCTVACKCWD